MSLPIPRLPIGRPIARPALAARGAVRGEPEAFLSPDDALVLATRSFIPSVSPNYNSIEIGVSSNYASGKRREIEGAGHGGRLSGKIAGAAEFSPVPWRAGAALRACCRWRHGDRARCARADALRV